MLTNLITAAGASHSNSTYANRTKTLSGSEAQMYDGNDSTYWNVKNVASGAGQEEGYCYMNSTTTWSTPIRVTSVRAKMYTRCYSWGNYANRGATPYTVSNKIEIPKCGDL